MGRLSKLIGMIQNENMKIYRRWRTWIMLGIMLLFFGFIVFVMATFSDGAPIPIQPSALDVMMLSASFVTFVALFCAIVAGDIVSSEFSWGTVKLLLIRPISRSKVLLAKYIAVLIFTIFFIVILMVYALLLGLIFYGWGETNTTFIDVLIEYAYTLPSLIIGFTIAFMISAIFRSGALAIGLSIFMMVMGGDLLVMLLSRYEWAKYILYFNTNLMQYRHGGTGIIEGMSMGFSLTILAIYYVLFMALAFWFFNKRDVSN